MCAQKTGNERKYRTLQRLEDYPFTNGKGFIEGRMSAMKSTAPSGPGNRELLLKADELTKCNGIGCSRQRVNIPLNILFGISHAHMLSHLKLNIPQVK